MQTSICTNCNKELPVSCFNKNRTAKNGIQNRCKGCAQADNKAHYDANFSFVKQYKLDQGCQQCGYNENSVALQLNHRDPSTKDKKVGSTAALRYTWGRSRIINELAKCDVLCANCHAIHSYEQGHLSPVKHRNN